jgi:uncharacterized protein YdiU (UPF0061 family)
MKAQLVNPIHRAYAEFDRINGEHSFKEAVPGGCVDYQARTRHGGRVAFFNFQLAKEMGLLPDSHPETMNDKLERKLLETFSLVIINEYDIQHKTPVEANDVRPGRFMATRYLQLQHPNKQGKTSGDGRGIWNGEFRGRSGTTWDVTSSGTGATRLSPAAAQTGRNFRTGDKRVGYGNGYNTLDEGFSAALMSEIFHQNGIGTERTLVIIGFSGPDDGTSINVRAGRNLMRPSHFFCHLKQARLVELKGLVDYYIDRQAGNGLWPSGLRGEQKYRFFADEMARVFARSAARFESDYIFCWMDWDGDNILADGGIIDYGSVRQFGLYYGDYRYDDSDRYSTRLPEQRLKARYIVQCFAQIRDFCITGRKRAVRRFKRDPSLKIFDEEFAHATQSLLLDKVGFPARARDRLLKDQPQLVAGFSRAFAYFERVRSIHGVYDVADGLNRDAVFCMRDFLREYPRSLYQQEANAALPAKTVLEMMAARKSLPEDTTITPFRDKRVSELQEAYAQLIAASAGEALPSGRARRVLLEVLMRASVINKKERITGDAAVLVTENFIRWHRRVPRHLFHQVFRAVVEHQQFTPARPRKGVSIKRGLEKLKDELKAELRAEPGSGAPRASTPARTRKASLITRSLRLIRKHCESL